MLETIFGNKTAEKIMLYLFHYGEAYASGISKDMGITLSQVQKQLDKFDDAGILVNKMMGNTRIYQFNPKHPAVKRLKDLIEIFYETIPLSEREKIFAQRHRPRRKGKPVIKVGK